MVAATGYSNIGIIVVQLLVVPLEIEPSRVCLETGFILQVPREPETTIFSITIFVAGVTTLVIVHRQQLA
jgi:hypothetical protein